MMRIDVLVDRESEAGWLKYVLDNFVLVSRMSLALNVCSQAQHSKRDSSLVITYGIENNLDNERVISIPRVNDYQPRDYSYIVADELQDSRIEGALIPVFQKTFAPEYSCSGKPLLKSKVDGSCCAALMDNGIKLSFDLFYNSFVHLSCLEEWEYEKRFGPIHAYAGKLKGMDTIYQKPIVNYLFAILEDILLLLVDEPHRDTLFRKRKGFQICLTHDVDYIRKTASLRAKRSAFYLSSGFRDLGKAKLPGALKKIYRSLCFLLSPCDYWQFEYIQELEEAHNFRSTFYVYAGVRPRQMLQHLRRLVFDPGYDVEENVKLQDKIKELTEKGWEVGLHGSFDSYNSPELLLEEKNRLEAISGLPVLSTRQHWLHLSLRNTWKIQAEAGIRADTTLGFNDCVGFRTGVASSFYPYDFDGRERHQILEVPMVLMDGTLFDHCQMDDDEALEKSLEILGEVKKFNGCVAVNWHQRTPAVDYKWYWLYQEILSWIKQNKGEGIPLSRCVEALDQDEALLQRTG